MRGLPGALSGVDFDAHYREANGRPEVWIALGVVYCLSCWAAYGLGHVVGSRDVFRESIDGDLDHVEEDDE